MGGTSKQTQQTSSQTNPWQPTVQPLTNLVGQLDPSIANTGPNQTETGALNTLRQNAASGNPYAGQIGQVANTFLSGGADNSGLVNNAYSQYAQNIAPWANGSMADPANNPALANALATVRSDVSNSVNGMFAGAGRDLSGANQQALARGISQGEAPLLLQAQQEGLNQAGNLYNAGGSTAGILANLNAQRYGLMGQGINAADSALQARDSAANQQLGVEQQARGVPLSNISNIAGILGPIAGLGGQSTGQSSGSYTMSPMQQALMGSHMFSSMFGGSNASVPGFSKFMWGG
jgi:hypothetical protein